MSAKVEEFFRDRGSEAEASGGIFAVDDKQIDGIGFKDVGKMFADDMAAGGAKDIADKEDIHSKSLHGAAESRDHGLLARKEANSQRRK